MINSDMSNVNFEEGRVDFVQVYRMLCNAFKECMNKMVAEEIANYESIETEKREYLSSKFSEKLKLQKAKYKEKEKKFKDQIYSMGNERRYLQFSVTQMKLELDDKNRMLEQLETQSKATAAETDVHVKDLQKQLKKAVSENSEFKKLLDYGAAERKELLENNQFLKDENVFLKRNLASNREIVHDLKSELKELQELLVLKTEELKVQLNKGDSFFFALEKLIKMADKIEEVNKLKESDIIQKNLEIDSFRKEIMQLALRIQSGEGS